MTKRKQAEFVKWFGPLLDALRDLGDSGKPREVSEKIASNLNLPDEILDETLKSGGSRFHNQVAWARQYLVWEGLLDSSKHGTWKLTEKGKNTSLSLEESREIFLKWVEIHRKARESKKAETLTNEENIIEELEEKSPGQVEKTEDVNLIEVLRNLTPLGFEKVCRELLRESGFENVEITGGSHDEGIDGYGTLEINPFVSFKVLFQCKRYQAGNTVSRAQVGDFRNAMMGRAEKGIIITTSSFSNAAIKEANRAGATPVELVDGEKLVEMFEKVELGVDKETIYKVQLSYFEKYK
jgi:restriction system protein